MILGGRRLRGLTNSPAQWTHPASLSFRGLRRSVRKRRRLTASRRIG
jgi:hypothetical protein